MKLNVLTLGAILAMTVAQAQAQTMVTDTDGNGTYSIEELTAAYPDMTEELFGEIDTNDDSAVDEAELTAAREAGLIAA